MVYGEVLCFMDKSSLLIIRQIRWVGCCVETFMIFTNSSGATIFIFHFSNTVLCFQLSSGLCMFLKLAPGCFLCIPISLFFALIRLRPSVAGCHSAPCPVSRASDDPSRRFKFYNHGEGTLGLFPRWKYRDRKTSIFAKVRLQL